MAKTQVLLKVSDINHQNNEGNTALISVVVNGYLDTIFMIITVNILIIEGGANPNIQNNKGDTVLTIAAVDGKTELVQNLLRNGARVNHKNKKGDTPLILAARWGKIDTVKVLLKANADMNSVNNDGNTMLFYFTDTYPGLWKPSIFTAAGHHPHHINVHHMNKNGQTALFTVSAPIAAFLLKEGADVNHLDHDGKNALFYTTQLDKGQLLMDHGIDVHHTDNDGKTVGQKAKKRTAIIMLHQLGIPIPAELVDWIPHDQEFVDGITNAIVDVIKKQVASGQRNADDVPRYKVIIDDIQKCYQHISDEYSWRLGRWILENSQIMLTCCPEAKEYTRGSDEIINTLIRHQEGEWDEPSLQVVQDMYRALDETSPLPEDITVYRGIRPYGDMTFDNLQIGDTLNMEGFLSFSIDFDTATTFTHDHTDGMILKTQFPAGIKTLFLDRNFETSYFPEKELITYPNLQIQVTAKYDYDGQHIIEVKLVTTGELELTNVLADIEVI